MCNALPTWGSGLPFLGEINTRLDLMPCSVVLDLHKVVALPVEDIKGMELDTMK